MSDALDRLVEVMDRLRSPGGCPWDAEQTHESLVPHAIEETYELVEAIEAGSRDDMREELGDVLLQVVFHARVAEEDAGAPFGLDDVAREVTAKLIERHPHVFADAEGGSAEDVYGRWERIKGETKQRESTFDGIPVALPALARAQKVVGRGVRAGLIVPEASEASASDAADATASATSDADETTASALGAELLALVTRAQAQGIDAEGALRAATRDLEQRLRAAE